MRTTTTKADISLVLITALWGTSFLIVKDALGLIDPYRLLLFRFALATAVLLLMFMKALRTIDRSSIWKGAVLGLVLYLGFLFQTTGLQYTTPAKSAFITGVNVLLVPVFGVLFFRSRLTAEVILGVCVAFAGLFLITRPDNLDRINPGDILTLICSAVFALQILLVERYSREVGTEILALLQLGWTAVWALPLAVFSESSPPQFGWSLSLSIVYLSVFCTAIAFSVQIGAQRQVTAARAALIFALEPVFAAIASSLFYGERLTWLEWLGGFLVVAGVLLGEFSVLRSKSGTTGVNHRISP